MIHFSHVDLGQFSQRAKPGGYPFVVAHRGTPTIEPENTLPSFALALDQGADALETDLRFTRDDEIVLFHDATLERTTDGQGPVRDHTLAELRRFPHPAPGRHVEQAPVPTLVDLLIMTQARTPLLLGLKDRRFLEPRYAQKLLDTLTAYGVLQSCAIVSFEMDLVRAVNRVNPDIPSGMITLWNPLPPAGTAARPALSPALLEPGLRGLGPILWMPSSRRWTRIPRRGWTTTCVSTWTRCWPTIPARCWQP
ncbi:MAG: glycerophosphodiester phosphodiesterase family protein [Caldilineaceae bacterium]